MTAPSRSNPRAIRAGRDSGRGNRRIFRAFITAFERSATSIVLREIRRIGEQRADVPHVVRARELFFNRLEARVKAFAPADQVSARVFVGQVLAIAMRALHLENLRAFDSGARSARRKR